MYSYVYDVSSPFFLNVIHVPSFLILGTLGTIFVRILHHCGFGGVGLITIVVAATNSFLDPGKEHDDESSSTTLAKGEKIWMMWVMS